MSDPSPRIVLASASPRRLELLRQAGYELLVDPADVDETPDPASPPADNAARFARGKALAVLARHPHDLVIGADTIVVVAHELMGKPRDEADARRMLRRLAGRAHQVITCVHLMSEHWPEKAMAVTTQVVFRDLDDDELEGYLRTGEWRGKAGAYAVQGRAASFTQAVFGSYSNVVGLPICEVVEALRARGLFATRHEAAA